MLIEHLSRQLRERDAQSLRRRRRVLDSPCGPHALILDGAARRPLLAFCSNDYLGLAADERLQAALAEGARRWGVGSGASHLVCGHSRAHEDLEQVLADWLAACLPGATALAFGSGYMANVALLAALGDAQATLFTDKLNHASLIDGAQLARAEVRRYPHGRLDRLAAELEACATPIKLVVTDGVFSMDGDLAALPEILALAERHDAWVVLDDAHGLGVLGAQGRGSLAHFGLASERVILMGTLGKAVGVAGAFVCAHPVVIDGLVQAARPYIYTTAAPPSLAHATTCSIALVRGAEGDARRARLCARIEQLRTGLAAIVAERPRLGWRLPESRTPIQPLVVGDNAAALRLSERLEARGLWVTAIRPPTVPPGSARLRIALSAAHGEDDVARLLEALAGAADEFAEAA